MSRGIFITVEGPDGSGKSTQMENIKEYIRSIGLEAIFTREPGGTPISEKIRAIILDRENDDLSPMTEALLYAASRAQHVDQMIKPALERGRIVVCDRFTDSSIAYQGYARNLGESVSIINQYATGGCIPDVTFLLKIDPRKALMRLDGPADRLESETLDFHNAVYKGYEELEKKYPERIIAIDADRPCDEVKSQITECLKMVLGDRDDT